METRDLTPKIRAKLPKIARNCESWVSTACRGSVPAANCDNMNNGSPGTSRKAGFNRSSFVAGLPGSEEMQLGNLTGVVFAGRC